MSRDTLFASASAGDSDYRLIIDDDGTKIEAAFPGDDDIEFHELIANADGIDDICTLLHSESLAGNAERVRYIVRTYADKNILVKLDSNKETALHIAADCGNTEIVEILIDAARSRLPTSAHEDPHHPITCFEDFIRHPNDSMNTALHLAVSNGHMAIAKRLVEADPNDKHIQNSKGETPIYLAAKLGYEEMVQMMCEACTAPSLAGPDGTTALHAAIMMLTEGKNEGLAVVTALINAAKTSASSANRSRSSVRSFLRQSNKEDKDTALHLAVRRNHLDVVELILRADPSLLIKNDRNHDFKSTIYKAAEQGYRDMVILLCKRYDEVQNNLVCKGLTGLCAAIIGRDKESVLGILRRAKHLVTNVDHRGWTPLHYAAYYEFDSVLELIVKAQVSVKCEAVYKAVPTPLFLAAQKGHTSTVIGLMKLLPDSCIVTNNQGQNILHLAAAQNNEEMVRHILLNCPQKYTETILNGKDVNGNTPIHLLICHGCFIPGLLHNNKWPVDMTIRNKWEWTPEDMLYFEEDIIGDQLQIKIKFDRMHTLPWKFWRIPSTRESSMPLRSMGSSSTSESLVPSSKRSRKDAKFEMAEKMFIKEEGKRSRQIVNTQIVITALITTITFTVGFTMPGGLHQSGEPDQGLTILSKKNAFNAFMVSDTIALTLSSTCLFFYFKELYSGKPLMQVTTAAVGAINMASVFAMMLTFVSGTIVVLSNSPALAITVALISCLFFIEVIVVLIKTISDRRIKEQKSSVSMSRYF